MKMRYLYITSALLFIISICSCGIYGRAGESRTYTIKVGSIENQKNIISTELNYQISEKLKDKLRNQADFYLVDSKTSDYKICGKIADYQIRPFVIGSNEMASINRVGLFIDISLHNNIEEGKTTIKNCKTFVDFDAKQNFGEIEDSITEILSSKMADEVYYQLFMGW
jgi:hypothetical protein